MKPENKPLEKDVPFQTPSFSGFMIIFWIGQTSENSGWAFPRFAKIGSNLSMKNVTWRLISPKVPHKDPKSMYLGDDPLVNKLLGAVKHEWWDGRMVHDLPVWWKDDPSWWIYMTIFSWWFVVESTSWVGTIMIWMEIVAQGMTNKYLGIPYLDSLAIGYYSDWWPFVRLFLLEHHRISDCNEWKIVIWRYS